MQHTRFLLLLLIALVLTACSFSLAEDITPPPGSEVRSTPQQQPAAVSGPSYPLVPPNPEAGREIFNEKCAPCHGTNGLGDGPQAAQLPNPPAPLGSPDYARQGTPANWYTQVTKGNLEKFMPPFNSLSDRQRWDVVAYSLSLSVSVDDVEQGKMLYQANCAGCHGESGQGDGPEAASSAIALPDLSDQSFMALKSSSEFFMAITDGLQPGMPALGETLSEEQRWYLAAYLRSLTFAAGDAQPITVEPSPTAESTSVIPEELSPTSTITATREITPALEFGVVSGNVVNASGGAVPDDLEITLYGFDNMQLVFTDTVMIQPDQKYVFQSVEMLPERAFLVTTEHEGNTYGSDIAVVNDGDKLLDLPLEIYETTTDASILRVDRLHLFFEFIDANNLRVIELYIMSNPTDKALVPEAEGQPTVRFTLPEGATNLEFQDGVLGDRYIQTADGFGDTAMVRPGMGSYEVLFAYEMPYNRKLDLVKPMNLPIDALVILIPEDGIKVKGEMLMDEGTRDVDGTPYHLYNGGSLQAGEQLSLTISGKPSVGSPSLITGSNTSLVIGLGVFGLALVGAGVWLYLRSRQVEDGDEDEFEPVREAQEEESVETVIDAIIALDDLYQRGELPEEAYQQRRAELKSRLREKI